MSISAYLEYKDSGVEWLGSVPSDWQVMPLWTLYRRTKRTGFEFEQLLSVYRDHGVIPKASRDDNNNKPSDDLSVYQLVEPGDLAINKMKAWQGSVGVSAHRGIVSPAYFVYEATHNHDGRFLHYLLRSPRYITAYLSMSKGIRVNQWDLEPQYHSRIPVLLPSINEQREIAAFLDHEIAKIDALVEEQQRLIELLHEKRQAFISHVVTKGLDPTVSMKDSGVEWIGHIPKHWQVDRLKWSVTSSKNGVWGDDAKQDSNDIACVRVADFDRQRLRVELDEPTIRNITPSERVGRVLVRGDLLLEKSGGGDSQPVGCVVLYDDDRPAVCSNFVARVQSAENMDSSFWRYFHAAAYFIRLNTKSIKQTSGIQNLDASQYLDEIGVFPPHLEQVQIADYLDRQTAKLDALIGEAKDAVFLFQERRTALISAAVTGKIDVRNWQAKEQKEEVPA